MLYLANINLNKNELQNAVIQPLAAAPESPKLGQIYYNSTTSKLMQYNGTAWKTVGVVVESSEVNGSIKVDGVEMTVYTLPAATSTTLGGIKVGAGFTIGADGTLVRNIAYYTGIRAAKDGTDPVEYESDNEVFTRVLNGAAPVEGDVFVIKSLIGGDKYSYASFVYDNSTWNAMDGNVDATNVIMKADIVTAGDYTQVGNVTKGKTETKSISAAGKSVAEVFQAIFTKELNPSKSDPAVTISNFPSGAKEVGSVVTPKWSATLSAGSYTYGPATGIVATGWSITDSDGHTSTDASGSFADVTVTDTTNYTITAVASHGQGAMPKTNLGNEYSGVRIAEGSKSKTSGAITGFRKFFYGSKATPVELNSANIRGLTNSTEAVGTSKTFDVEVVEGALQVIIAFPTNINKTLSAVLDANAFGTDVVGSFKKSVVKVEGAAAGTEIDYDVWVFNSDAALSANTYTVTIA